MIQGLFSSPHLHSIRERIRVDGQLIPKHELVRICGLLRHPRAPRMPDSVLCTTFFDRMLAVALAYFCTRRVQAIVLETGIGGRHDATRFVPLVPRACVITSISFDHVRLLCGIAHDQPLEHSPANLQAIARSKAGIIRAHVPVITSTNQADIIKETLVHEAQLLEAPIEFVAPEYADELQQRPTLQGGAIQRENCALVRRCIELVLIDEHEHVDEQRSRRAIEQGIATTYWPCRYEQHRIETCSSSSGGTSSVRIILDAAHNIDSITKLYESVALEVANQRALLDGTAASVHELSNATKHLHDQQQQSSDTNGSRQHHQIWSIFGCSSSDRQGMVPIVGRCSDRVALVEGFTPHAARTSSLMECLVHESDSAALTATAFTSHQGTAAALSSVLEHVQQVHATQPSVSIVVVVCGSVFLASQCRAELHGRGLITLPGDDWLHQADPPNVYDGKAVRDSVAGERVRRAHDGMSYAAVMSDLSAAAGYPIVCVKQGLHSVWKLAEQVVWRYDYDLGLNGASVSHALADRCLVYELLRRLEGDGDGDGSGSERARGLESLLGTRLLKPYRAQLPTLREWLARYGRLVIKPVMRNARVESAQANDVRLASNEHELQACVLDSDELRNGLAIVATRYVQHEAEYRVVVFEPEAHTGGRADVPPEVVVVLEFLPLVVVGDGIHTIAELVMLAACQLRRRTRYLSVSKVDEDMRVRAAIDGLDADHHVLAPQQRWQATWRLKRSIGASVRVLARTEPMYARVTAMALRVLRRIPASFVSIGMLHCRTGEACEQAGDGGELVVHTMSAAQALPLVLEFVDDAETVAFLRRAYECLVARATAERVSFAPLSLGSKIEQRPVGPSVPYEERRHSLRAQLRRAFPHSKLEFYSYDYLCTIDRRCFGFRFNFGIESSTSIAICKDKAAAAAVLQHCGVPCVPHLEYSCFGARYSSSNSNSNSMGLRASVGDVRELEHAHVSVFHNDSVLKPTAGSCGMHVKHLGSGVGALELALVKHTEPRVLSPFIEIVTETRAIVLESSVVLMFDKRRLELEGDGHSNVAQLLTAYAHSIERIDYLRPLLKLTPEKLSHVPAVGERFLASWMHNLCAYAHPEPVAIESPRGQRLAQLAIRAANAVDLHYGAVDMIEDASGHVQVLELNGTPGFDRFTAIFGEHATQQLLDSVVSLAQRKHRLPPYDGNDHEAK